MIGKLVNTDVPSPSMPVVIVSVGAARGYVESVKARKVRIVKCAVDGRVGWSWRWPTQLCCLRRSSKAWAIGNHGHVDRHLNRVQGGVASEQYSNVRISLSFKCIAITSVLDVNVRHPIGAGSCRCASA